jgi:DNA-binding MarR family transcriptional regulator
VLRLSRTPGHLIRRAQQVHTAIWAQRLHGELTGPQYSALLVLAMEPGIDQSRLAKLASLDKNTASDVVRRLAAHGWIQRSAHPGDGRRRVLRLSAPARAAMRSITPAAALVQDDLLRPIAADRRKSAIDLLARVARADARPPPGAGSRADARPATPGAASRADARQAAPGAGADEPLADVPVLAMYRTPGYLIRRAQQIHGRIWGDVVGTELTGPQYAVLAALAAQPGADQATVGRLASLDTSSAAGVVSRLERGGWVRRARSAPTGRHMSLCPSAAAAERLDRITPLVDEVQAEFLRPLGAREARSFVADLALIAYRGVPPDAG